MNSSDFDLAGLRRNDYRTVIGNGVPASHSAAGHGGSSSRRLAHGFAALVASIALGWAAGCNGGSNDAGGSTSGNEVGSVVDQPDPSIGSLHFVVDANQGGSAAHPRILSLSWGRLANIYDATGTLQQRDMVIGRDIPQVDPLNLRLEVSPVTGETSVTITNFAYGTPGYLEVFEKLDANLTPIQDKSLEPDELPPYSLAPRNSALIIRFDDLLDSTTITPSNIKLLTGNPPLVPFDARVIPDINHGDTADFTHVDVISGDVVPGGDGVPEFHTTRVIIDTTVSELESAGSNPPLPINALGLPASPSANLPNVAIRLPTVVNTSAGQLTILQNPSGNSVSFTQSGSTDPDSLTDDVVRAFRSGNNADQNHGFLFDDIPPEVVGTQPVFLGTITPDSTTTDPNDFRTTVTFSFLDCASRLKQGDVLQQPGVFAQVVTESADPSGNQVAHVTFEVIFPPNGQLVAGPAQVSSTFDPLVNFGQQACFVRFPSIGDPPDAEVATDSSVIVRFSEPIDPVTVKPFDSLTITRIAGAPNPSQFVVGQITPSSDLRQFTFVPVLPFKHTNGSTSTQYWINMGEGLDGPTDLAGNPLAAILPQVRFVIDPDEATENNAGFALRFSSTDELNDGVTLNGPELRGQFLYDVINGILRPRTVTRFAAAATREKPVPAIMSIPALGVQTPLSPLGSRLHAIWRYCDVGFGLLDESFFNVDVEGLNWAPIGGSVVSDQFTRFEMSLCHSLKLPDESINPATLLPLYGNSGLVQIFGSNVLSPTTDPLRVVHHRALGYVVDPADRFLSNTTPVVTMMPYPLNRNLPVSQHSFYTWRDTSIQAKGGPSLPGAELAIVVQVLNLNPNTIGNPFPPNAVPTIALPLLMEFKCFPDTEALGLNSFDINIAINSSSIPNFRAFSTGGTNSSGTPVIRDPDLESIAQGGFNPNSNPPGLGTIPVDPVFYIGQMDLIIRISRAHSIWFNTLSGTTVYSPPVVEPRPSDQPAGTSIDLAFRGASNATGLVTEHAADGLNAYGDIAAGGGTVTFLGNDSSWKTGPNAISQIQGARFFQVRITFQSNAETLLTPTLSALGFAFRQ